MSLQKELAYLGELLSQLKKQTEENKFFNKEDLRFHFFVQSFDNFQKRILCHEVLVKNFENNLPLNKEELYPNCSDKAVNEACNAMLEEMNLKTIGDLFLDFWMETEMLIKILYSKKSGDGNYKNMKIPIILSCLFNDQNPPIKNEAKVFFLLSKIRNTIHFSGINVQAESYEYKNTNYDFVIDKGNSWFSIAKFQELIIDAFTNIYEVVNTEPIKLLPEIKHPFYLHYEQ